MIPVETSYMLVDTERAVDLDDVMDKMLHGDDAYRYSVAWIDCQSTGQPTGPLGAHPGRPRPPGRPARPPGRRPGQGPRLRAPPAGPGARRPRRAACSTR